MMDEPVGGIRLQGVLEKKGKFTGVLLTRKYFCTLEDGQLKYRKEGEKEKGLDILSVQSIRPGRDCSFEIVTRSSTHNFVAGSVSERDDWVKALRESMGTSSLRMSSCRFPPRSYSEDSTALYETIDDSPKASTKFPRSLTLSASSKSKSQKWLSTSPYETVNDPPDVIPSKAFHDSAPKISTDFTQSMSPQAACGLYESVKEDPSNLVIYEGDLEEVSPLSSLQDESPVDPNLYAYARAEDIKKVLVKEKPRLCFEYSTVHDSRGSELLYSEVGMWAGVQEQANNESGKAVCGLAKVVEVTGGAMPDNGNTAIYQLAKDPDATMAKNQSQQREEDCYSEIKTSSEETTRRRLETPKLSSSTTVLPKSLDVATKASSDNDRTESSNSRNRTVGLKAPLSTKECSMLPVYGKVEKQQCIPFPQRPLPSPPLSGNSADLDCSSLNTQVMKPSSDFYTKVSQPSSNDAFSMSHSTSASLTSCPIASCSSALPPNVASDVCCQVVQLDTNSPTISYSLEGSSCSEMIPKLPNPKISSKHRSPFEEMRTVVGEIWKDGEVDELMSVGAPKGTSAVDELRQFLQKLDK